MKLGAEILTVSTGIRENPTRIRLGFIDMTECAAATAARIGQLGYGDTDTATQIPRLGYGDPDMATRMIL